MFGSTQAPVTNDASAKPILPEWAANLWNRASSAMFSKPAPATAPGQNGGKRKSKRSRKSSRKTSRRHASKK